MVRPLNDIVPQLCSTGGLWDNIKGWEVIVAVLIIMAGWSATNIARMHYMVQMSKAKQRLEDD